MKIVHLLLLALAVCFLNACERQPASKIHSMTEEEHAGAEPMEKAHAEKAEHAAK